MLKLFLDIVSRVMHSSVTVLNAPNEAGLKTREAMKTTKKDLMVLCLIIISVIFLFLICARHEKTREDLLREQQMEQESEWKGNI